MSTDFAPIDATLKNGTAIRLRPLQPDDRDRMAAAVHGLDPQTIYTRLFSHRKELSAAGLDRIMHTDPEREVVLVATTGSAAEESIVGGGRYIVTSEGRAEIAFTVEEDFQGQGVGGRLFEALVAIARRHGISVFEADVLAENTSMLRVFERSARAMKKRRDGEVVHVEMALADAPSSGPAAHGTER